MTRDFLHINDFIVLVETGESDEQILDACTFEEPVIAVAFYGSGNVELEVKYGDKSEYFKHTKGLALSFHGDKEVEFVHKISQGKPLQCIVVATACRNLERLPNAEGEIFRDLLNELVNPSDHFVAGPTFFMTPEMELILYSLFNIQYQGKTKMMFFRSQITALLSHFFGQLALPKSNHIKEGEREKLYQVKELLIQNLDNPPSLSEISSEIGLNTHNLKKNFKELFGVPVFKYLQNERLNKAHALIKNTDATIQEAAWQVGYDSLSSFSNSFVKKFGYRPSEIKG